MRRPARCPAAVRYRPPGRTPGRRAGGGRGYGGAPPLDEFGIAKDGRLFQIERGGVVGSTAYPEVRAAARFLALTPEQAASPLARRPYDLRHAAVSLWLNAGVPLPRWRGGPVTA
ncbi:hypothetical protein GCM10018953_04020 [Streptosporangium nondiastaticum]